MDLTNNQKVKLPSGAELEMTMLPFTEGRRLYNAVAKCLKRVNVDMNTDVKDINALKNAFIEVSTDESVEAEILNALKKCTYNNERILSWNFFDNVDRREDYFLVCWEVLKFNIYPLGSRLFAKLSSLLNQSGQSPKSK